MKQTDDEIAILRGMTLAAIRHGGPAVLCLAAFIAYEQDAKDLGRAFFLAFVVARAWALASIWRDRA